MKKNQMLAGIFLAGITLGACTEDYTDWADPQSNSLLKKRPLNMKSVLLQVPMQLWIWISFTVLSKRKNKRQTLWKLPFSLHRIQRWLLLR